jgi:putative flippase GtrA
MCMFNYCVQSLFTFGARDQQKEHCDNVIVSHNSGDTANCHIDILLLFHCIVCGDVPS